MRSKPSRIEVADANLRSCVVGLFGEIASIANLIAESWVRIVAIPQHVGNLIFSECYILGLLYSLVCC